MKPLLLLLLLTISARAEDWTIKGQIYHEVKVVTIAPDAVSIMDSDGGARIDMADMPPDLQARFHYDPVAAKAAAAQRLIDDKAAADAMAAQKQQDALARAQQAKEAAAQQQQESQAQAQLQQKKIAAAQAQAAQAKLDSLPTLKVHIVQVLADGFLANPYVPVEHFASAFSSQSGTTYELSDSVIFVQFPTDGLVDNQEDTVKASQSGTYVYTDTTGGRRTVPKYTGFPLSPTPSQTTSDFNPGSMNPPH